LYPSVQVLLHTHKLSASEISPTGPDGRLLKGDVLAHIGDIPSSYPKEASALFSKLSHLDLSNIKPAPPPKTEEKAAPAALEEEVEEVLEVTLPIDLKPVLKLQHRLQDVLGHTPELAELIHRAIDLSNSALPADSKSPSADELFDGILGVPSFTRTSHGHFTPLVNNLAPVQIESPVADIFDELISPVSRRKVPAPHSIPPLREGAINDFSVTVPPEDKKRATVFLQRMKSVLEVEPGRLVL
jgi:hypothetical protein